FFFSGRRRHTRFSRDWSSDVCSSDLQSGVLQHAQIMIVELVTMTMALANHVRAVKLMSKRTGLQTALLTAEPHGTAQFRIGRTQIGRASCRGRGWVSGAGAAGRATSR